jgi:hypothetical protein
MIAEGASPTIAAAKFALRKRQGRVLDQFINSTV